MVRKLLALIVGGTLISVMGATNGFTRSGLFPPVDRATAPGSRSTVLDARSVAASFPQRVSVVEYRKTGALIMRLSSTADRTDITRRVRSSGGRMMFWLDRLAMSVVSGVSADAAQGWPGVESVVADIELPLPQLQSSQSMTPQSEAQAIFASPVAQQQWNMRQIRADVAIDRGHSGEGAVVAVIDSGIFAEHPDLIGNVLAEQGRNFYAPYFSCAGTPLGEPPNDPRTGDCPATESLAIAVTAGDPDNTTDDLGHGTYVAGIIAAHGGEHRTGMVGVAPDAKLLPVRVCSTEGVCPLGAVAAGIAFAVEQGATVASMALNANVDISTSEGAELFEISNTILDFAFDNGLTVIGPAGNSLRDFDQETTIRPLLGWFDNVVTATGVGPTGRPSSNQDVAGNLTFQRPSPFVNTGRYIDIAGPGGDFPWTRPNDTVISTSSPIGILGPPGLYSVGAGSSVGSSHVTGVAALVVAKFGPQNPKKLMKILYDGTIDLGPRGRDSETGFGLIDIPRTLGLD